MYTNDLLNDIDYMSVNLSRAFEDINTLDSIHYINQTNKTSTISNRMTRIAVEAIANTLGVTSNISLEDDNEGSGTVDKIIAFLKRMWQGVVDAVKWIGKKIKEVFDKLFGNNSADVKEVKEEVKAAKETAKEIKKINSKDLPTLEEAVAELATEWAETPNDTEIKIPKNLPAGYSRIFTGIPYTGAPLKLILMFNNVRVIDGKLILKAIDSNKKTINWFDDYYKEVTNLLMDASALISNMSRISKLESRSLVEELVPSVSTVLNNLYNSVKQISVVQNGPLSVEIGYLGNGTLTEVTIKNKDGSDKHVEEFIIKKSRTSGIDIVDKNGIGKIKIKTITSNEWDDIIDEIDTLNTIIERKNTNAIEKMNHAADELTNAVSKILIKTEEFKQEDNSASKIKNMMVIMQRLLLTLTVNNITAIAATSHGINSANKVIMRYCTFTQSILSKAT